MNAADIDLLTLAARAVGFTEFECRDGIGPRARKINGVAGPWNPLDNQEQAEEIRSKLGLLTGFDNRFQDFGACIYCTYSLTRGSCNSIMQNIAEAGGDEQVAHRRAIVRAAAEMAQRVSPAPDRLLARHNTTPEQMHAMCRELALWMYDKGIDEVHLSREPGTAKVSATIDGRPA